MGLAFRTLDEQIKILRNRGLLIQNDEHAKEILIRSNYYDIVNGYSSFLQSSKDIYKNGANFQELHAIYMYDKAIKSTIFRMIEKSEAFLRTAVAYYFSKNHTGSGAYLNINNFSDRPEVSKMFADIYRVISQYNRSNANNAISHYMHKYKEIPLWVIVNYFEFGLLRTFYSLMKDKDKYEIAKHIDTLFEKEYGNKVGLTPKEVDSYLWNINDVRNIVAHDNRLLHYKTRNRAVINKAVSANYSISDYRSVFHTYLTIRLFLTKEQYKNETSSLKNRTKNLKHYLVSCSIDDILNSLGFSIDWLTTDFDNMWK